MPVETCLGGKLAQSAHFARSGFALYRRRTLALPVHITVYTREGKSIQGETNGQEDVEEGKEDSTDQALDAASRTQPPLNFRVRARPHRVLPG